MPIRDFIFYIFFDDYKDLREWVKWLTFALFGSAIISVSLGVGLTWNDVHTFPNDVNRVQTVAKIVENQPINKQKNNDDDSKDKTPNINPLTISNPESKDNAIKPINNPITIKKPGEVTPIQNATDNPLNKNQQ